MFWEVVEDVRFHKLHRAAYVYETESVRQSLKANPPSQPNLNVPVQKKLTGQRRERMNGSDETLRRHGLELKSGNVVSERRATSPMTLEIALPGFPNPQEAGTRQHFC